MYLETFKSYFTRHTWRLIAVQRIGVAVMKVLTASVEQQTGRERDQAFGVVVIAVQRQIVVVVDVVEVVAANSRLIIDIGSRRAWNVISTDVEVCVIVVVTSLVHSTVFMVVVECQILVM